VAIRGLTKGIRMEACNAFVVLANANGHDFKKIEELTVAEGGP
jgi:hypothetical protein